MVLTYESIDRKMFINAKNGGPFMSTIYHGKKKNNPECPPLGDWLN